MQVMLEASVKRVMNRTIHRQATIVGGEIVPTATIASPVRVRIQPIDAGCLLLHLDASGQSVADTWHASVAEAKAQAKFEFDIDETDWSETRVDEP